MGEITLDFLQGLLRADYPDVTIQNFEGTPGSKRGDNYTSMVYRISLTGVRRHASSDGSREVEEPWETTVIYKCLPESLKRREAFKSEELFCNEVAFYTKIWPAFMNFQNLWKIPHPFQSIPKCYLAHNECVVLKDLKREGFVMADRRQGLGLEQSYLVLKQLSHFHALSLAMKYHDPEGFYELINNKDGIKEVFYIEENTEYFKNYYREAISNALSMVEEELSESPDKEVYLDKFRRFCSEERFFHTMVELCTPKEPLAVICHGDCWTNNFLFKYVNGDLADMYLLDFQIARYASPAIDLVFILYLCMERELCAEHVNSLLEFYTDELHGRVLQMSDEDSIFTTTLNRDALHKLVMEEWRRCGEFALGTALDAFPVFTCDSDEAPNVYEAEDDAPQGSAMQPVHTSNAECRRRMTQLLMALVDNGII
ncbi:unnamed protein product [Arctia plantaginis]|uniref:CHK kinase-like domain-containing protein n=1 Tax=Arctia plantaginis TaxID=874455 RepID=A0A8S0YYV7_ARCPL|nr:unnamed protein product [Arctia plantaginis]